jgi:hypothetical protein
MILDNKEQKELLMSFLNSNATIPCAAAKTIVALQIAVENAQITAVQEEVSTAINELIR